jgi:hypothetical protein
MTADAGRPRYMKRLRSPLAPRPSLKQSLDEELREI